MGQRRTLAMVKRFVFASLGVLAMAAPAHATTGGDATVRILGWDAARSSILVTREPGGENAIVELFAFDLEQRRTSVASCETCLGLELGDTPRDADERAYLAVLKHAARLSPLVETPRSAWKKAGLEFSCASTQRTDPDSGHYRRQRCRLAVQGVAPIRFEFSAPSEWHSVRLFQPPGHTGSALAWVVHTGISELGYREHELVLAPSSPHLAVSCATFARHYGATTAQ